MAATAATAATGAVRRRTALAALALAAGSGAAGACATFDATGKRYTVNMMPGNQFDPASLTVPRGAVVSWKNVSAYPHVVSTDPKLVEGNDRTQLPKGEQPWTSRRLYNGEIWSRTFDTPGTYVYFSPNTDGEQMIGTITVLDTTQKVTPSPNAALLNPALPKSTPRPEPTPGKTPLPTPPSASAGNTTASAGATPTPK